MQKKYYTFNAEELRAILFGAIGLAFIISFNEWGVTTFDLGYGLRHLFNAFLIVILSFLVHLSVQRVLALWFGFKAEYRVWLYGLGIGLVLVIVSRGRLWFLAPGGIVVYHMVGHRLGSFRYGLNYWPLGLVGMSGPMASVILAIFFKFLLGYMPDNVLLQKALVFNIWYAIVTMLPIPPLDGSHTFFASRLFYTFWLGVVIGLCLALYFLPIWAAFLIGLLMGLVIIYLTYGLLK